jgi:hypothetical protein
MTATLDELRERCKNAIIIAREGGANLALTGALEAICARLDLLEAKFSPHETPTNPQGKRTPAYGFPAPRVDPPPEPPPAAKQSGSLTAVTKSLREAMDELKRTQKLDFDEIEDLKRR